MKPTLFQLAEQERHSDLYSVMCSLEVARDLVAELSDWHGLKRRPLVVQTKATTVSWCVWSGASPFRIELRQGFTLGDVCHEFVHVLRFRDAGAAHRHDHTFAQIMNYVCTHVRHTEWLLTALDGQAAA